MADSFDIESIGFYFDEKDGIVIIGYYNNPKGPGQTAGDPVILTPGASAAEIGTALREMYGKCLSFTEADVDLKSPPYKKIKGIKSWRQFANKHSKIGVYWYRNEKVVLEHWYRFSDSSFGGVTDLPDEIRELPIDAGDETIGEAVLELMATMREKGLTRTQPRRY
jgi:hypothetical protein